MAHLERFINTEEWEIAKESSGTKVGYWLVEPLGRRQALVKKARARSNPDFLEGEVVGEYLASMIGHQLGLSVAEVQLTHRDHLLCPLIWNFCKRDWELKEGVDLTNTRVSARYALSLPEIEEALRRTKLSTEVIQQYLTELICFDILIGNTDRHQHN